MFLVTILLFKHISAQNRTDWPEQDLQRDLLDDYEKSVRPGLQNWTLFDNIS